MEATAAGGDLSMSGRHVSSACAVLGSLPDSFGQLQALQTLILRGCGARMSLPGSLGQLQALQPLDLIECEAWEPLPDSLGQLQALQALHLRWYRALAS